jgi:hypothetical protein
MQYILTRIGENSARKRGEKVHHFSRSHQKRNWPSCFSVNTDRMQLATVQQDHSQLGKATMTKLKLLIVCLASMMWLAGCSKTFTPLTTQHSLPTTAVSPTQPMATVTSNLPYPSPYPPPGKIHFEEAANRTLEAEQEAAATASTIPLATKQEANIVLANTPWPTFTPYPSPTQKPGPTPTPIPLIAPAKNSEGTIVYFARDKDGNKDFNAIAVDKTGMIKSTTTLKTNVKAPEGEIYKSPDGSQLAMIGPWRAGAILNIWKGVITPFDEKKV